MPVELTDTDSDSDGAGAAVPIKRFVEPATRPVPSFSSSSSYSGRAHQRVSSAVSVGSVKSATHASDDSVIEETPVKELRKMQERGVQFPIRPPPSLPWNQAPRQSQQPVQLKRSAPASTVLEVSSDTDSIEVLLQPGNDRSGNQTRAKPTQVVVVDDDPVSPVQVVRKKRKLIAKGQKTGGSSSNDTHNRDSDHSDLEQLSIAKVQAAGASERNVHQLAATFSHVPRAVVQQTLSACNGDVQAAGNLLLDVSTTSNGNGSRKEQVKAKPPARSLDSESDNDLSSDEAEHEDDEEVEARQTASLSFFSDAPVDQIVDYVQCTPEQAVKVVSLRPFKSFESLEQKLSATKGVSSKMIDSYQATAAALTSLDKLISRCEQIGQKLLVTLNAWSDALGQEATAKSFGGMLDGASASEAGKLQAAADALKYLVREQPNLLNESLRLKDYQKIGVSWLNMLFRQKLSGILADEMGLGKTAQVISLIAHLAETGENGPHLIICPSSTLDNWLREFSRWVPSGLKVDSYQGTQSERAELRDYFRFDEQHHVIITTYNMATGGKEDRAFFRKMKFRSMILDEGHMVKNVDSQRYKHLMAVNARFRLLLTGTPLQNNLQELMALLTFILPDLFLEDDSWKRIFKMKPGVDTISSQRIDRVKKLMGPFVLRRKKLQVLDDLPSKIEKIELCVLSPWQRQFYQEVLENAKLMQAAKKPQNIIMELRKGALHPLLFRRHYTDSKLAAMSKQIIGEEQYWEADPAVIMEDMQAMTDFELHLLCVRHSTVRKHQLSSDAWMNSAKIDRLKELLATCRANGDRCLIFSQFTMCLDILEQVMQTLGVRFLRLDGSTDVSERQHLIDEYQDDTSIQVFLLSTKAGGLGLNLTAANVVILHDLDFNPHNDSQAEDRAWRLGQTRDVTVLKLICQGTIEEVIYKRQREKLNLDLKLQSAQVSDDDQFDADLIRAALANSGDGSADSASAPLNKHILPVHDSLQEDIFNDVDSWGTNSDVETKIIKKRRLAKEED
ncbi:DNA-dependent ATPase fun30 [Sorochytrium milnesiophthora]